MDKFSYMSRSILWASNARNSTLVRGQWYDTLVVPKSFIFCGIKQSFCLKATHLKLKQFFCSHYEPNSKDSQSIVCRMKQALYHKASLLQPNHKPNPKDIGSIVYRIKQALYLKAILLRRNHETILNDSGSIVCRMKQALYLKAVLSGTNHKPF